VALGSPARDCGDGAGRDPGPAPGIGDIGTPSDATAKPASRPAAKTVAKAGDQPRRGSGHLSTSSTTRKRCGASPAIASPTGPPSRPGFPTSTPSRKRDFGRPLFIACSADLAESTNIAGFAKPFGRCPASGNYERDSTPAAPSSRPRSPNSQRRHDGRPGDGSTSRTDPFDRFEGFWAPAPPTPRSVISSTVRCDCSASSPRIATCASQGALTWAGHSGPETAEDSRTHFGIFSPGVTQLFPEGHLIDLHPWNTTKCRLVLAAALATDVPIVALHLTRPPIEIPDRAALGMRAISRRRARVRHAPVREAEPKSGTILRALGR